MLFRSYGACLLGSYNLVKYIKEVPFDTIDTPHGKATSYSYVFDLEQLKKDIPAVVRAMDNIIDNTTYPLPEQEEEAKAKRRMGLGVTGVANAGEILVFPSASPGSLYWCESVM